MWGTSFFYSVVLADWKHLVEAGSCTPAHMWACLTKCEGLANEKYAL